MTRIDRAAEARAEAERRLAERRKWLWETMGEHLSHTWGMGFQAGFREAADALCMDWDRRVEAYKKGYSDGRNERDCDPGAALDDAR